MTFEQALHDGDLDTARAILDELEDLPDTGGLWLPECFGELARSYDRRGRHDDAIAAQERAIALGWGGLPDPRSDIAEFHLRAGRAERPPRPGSSSRPRIQPTSGYTTPPGCPTTRWATMSSRSPGSARGWSWRSGPTTSRASPRSSRTCAEAACKRLAANLTNSSIASMSSCRTGGPASASA